MSENNEDKNEERTEERWYDLLNKSKEYVEEIAKLKADNERLSEVNTKHWQNQAEVDRKIERAYELVCEEINEERLDLDSNTASGLAEIFDWEYEREVEVVITAKISGTITIPAGKSLEDIEDEFDATLTLNYRKEREGFSWSSSSVDEIEIEEN
jgi:hypothetical protein